MPSWSPSSCARASPAIRFPRAPLALLEHLERCHDADEEPLEAGELVTPGVEPGGVDEHVVDEQIVTGTGGGSDGCSHPGREPLTGGSGNDRRVVPPQEPLGSARAVLHPPLIDCVPEGVDAEENPGLIREPLYGASDGRLARARRTVEKHYPAGHRSIVDRSRTGLALRQGTRRQRARMSLDDIETA